MLSKVVPLIVAPPEPMRPSAQARSLATGEMLFGAGAHDGPGWRLLSGALRLDLCDDGQERFVQLVLPGDLVGLEPMCGLTTLYSARALTACVLDPLAPHDDTECKCLLSQALAQQWARAADMAALRTGSVPERIKRLLLMLRPDEAMADQGQRDHQLPRIRDIATIVDTAPETVSRVISSLRRLDLLDDRQPCFARFDPKRLADSALPNGMTRSFTGGAARGG